MKAADAVERAKKLSPKQAADALRHEKKNKARKTVLRELDRAAGRSGT